MTPLERHTESLLRRYLAAMRLRRELADIMGDGDGVVDAREAERDGELAIKLLKAGIW